MEIGLYFLIAITAFIACIILIFFGIMEENLDKIWVGLYPAIIGVIFLFLGSNDEYRTGICNAIYSEYPNAIINLSSRCNSGTFTTSNRAYYFKIEDGLIYIIDEQENKSIIAINKNQTSIKFNAMKSSNESDVKSLIYSEYSPIEINYSDGDTTGYFKMDDKYYSFTINESNIIVKDPSGNIVNVISKKILK